MAKKTRISATKSRGKRGSGTRSRRAVPPPDDPLERHEDLIVDRLSAANGGGPAAAYAAILGAAGSRKGQTRAGRAVASRAVLATAHLRLAALRHGGGMRHREDGAPAAERRMAGPELMPPVPGISNWVQMGPSVIPNGQTYSPARVRVTGRVTAIAIDPTNPQTIYLGAAQGGIWKTTDGGTNWSPTSDGEVSLAIGSLALDPTNPQVLYAGTGEGNFSGDSYYGSGVLQSTNGGGTWTNLNPGGVFTGARFSRIAITPGTPQRIFAASSGGIYRSLDGGTTWSQMTSGLPAAAAATDVVIDPATLTTVYAAFWGQGIYRTLAAGTATPAWAKLAGGLPTSGFTRIALALAPSSPQTVYALMAGLANPNPSLAYLVNRFLRTTDGGTTWSSIALPSGNIGGQGFYNLNVTVDPTTPDIVYLSALSVWKASRDTITDTWTISNVGARIHPDNHAFAIDPTNHLVLYAGNDGGIYKSVDGGATWSDTINEGPCITQFEFIAQHPTSDAVVFGGTQDNGTEQFRNSAVFYHADDGDGGFTAVDQTQPHNVVSTYYRASPKRSVQAGRFGTWTDVSGGLMGASLFYPPLALDETNANNIAFGTDRVALDAAQGTGGWPTQIILPGVAGLVSAIHYVTSTLIYAGTTSGEVFRLLRSGSTWTATAIHAAPLPGNWIWDVVARPDDSNTVIVGMSGFGITHVWRGTVPATGPATWTSISGSGVGTTLPDIPVNAVVIDPAAPNTYYVGTDVGVYRTTNGGGAWTQFSQGLPNCAVFDMRLHAPSRLLRVGLHGRGMWERRLDLASLPSADLFFRDHLMDTGRVSPSPANVPAAFEDPLQHVALGDVLNWWMCADVKVDTLEGTPPSYQMAVADVDYAAFESLLAHRNAQRGRINRVYVQVHNRGIQTATGVTVKLLSADASAGLPMLPPDFWTAFPGNSTNTTQWAPIGSARVIPSLSPIEPVVLEWDWNTPTTAADHSCLLVVMDSAGDPIPAANKLFDPNQLVRTEKRVGLKNLHVVNAPPGTYYWTPFRFFAQAGQLQAIKIVNVTVAGWRLGLVFAKNALKNAKLTGISPSKPSTAMRKALRARLGPDVKAFDTTRLYLVKNLKEGATVSDLKFPGGGLRTMLLLAPSTTATSGGRVTILQEQGGRVAGGSTFVLRRA